MEQSMKTVTNVPGLKCYQCARLQSVEPHEGSIIWRGSCPTDAATIADVVRQRAPNVARVGLETGQLSNWLTLSLLRRGLPVICLDARHAKAALKMQINKTDANDAFGLAQVVRTGWFREVAVKSMDAHKLRLLLVARSQLVNQRQMLANTIRGLMKTFGIVIKRGSKGVFSARVRAAGEGDDEMMAIIEPMLSAWQALREQIVVFDRQMAARAKSDLVVQRLMTAPGVGVIVALAYAAVIDDPARFRHSESVGAYLGLTPRRYQSGEVDVSGHISRCGDGLLRSYLFEAATVILQRYSTATTLKAWGLAVAKRNGMRRAKVAVARKLAVILHRMWIDGTEFKGGAMIAA
jgi:transposase